MSSSTRYPVSIAVLLLAGIGLGGCMTNRIEHSKNEATGIQPHERVVVLETSYHHGNETEDEFVDCVSKRIQKGKNGLNVHADHEFVDIMFPWFEPRTAPRGPEGLPELLEKPGVQARMEESGVRYIIWVTGDTERSDSGGSLSCAIAPGGGGCFGLAWWQNDSTYAAAIWDVRKGTLAGEVSAVVNGTSVIPAVIIPIPLIARTQAAACKGLARELREFIIGSGPL